MSDPHTGVNLFNADAVVTCCRGAFLFFFFLIGRGALLLAISFRDWSSCFVGFYPGLALLLRVMVFSPLCSSGDSEIELHEYDPFFLSRKREKVLDSASQDIIYQVCAGNHSDASCSMELRLGYCHLPQYLIWYGFAFIYLHIILVRLMFSFLFFWVICIQVF